MSWLSKQIKSAGKVARKVAPVTRFTKYIPGPVGAISGAANLAGQRGKFGTNLAKDFGERAVVAASLYGGSKILGGLKGSGAAAAAGGGGAGGPTGGDPMMGDSPMLGGGGVGAGKTAIPGWRQALRGVLSGGKPVTIGNMMGRGGNAAAGPGGGGGMDLGQILKVAGGGLLSAEALRQARDRRKQQDTMLNRSTGIADELAQRARTLFAGSDRLRVPAEDAIIQALQRGRRAPVNTARFADRLNPYTSGFAA